jgi:hypothetical protein
VSAPDGTRKGAYIAKKTREGTNEVAYVNTRGRSTHIVEVRIEDPGERARAGGEPSVDVFASRSVFHEAVRRVGHTADTAERFAGAWPGFGGQPGLAVSLEVARHVTYGLELGEGHRHLSQDPLPNDRRNRKASNEAVAEVAAGVTG